MSAEPETETETETGTGFGIAGKAGWTIGGALGGALGAVAFGVLMWLFDPDVVAAAIPALYGFDPSTGLGMALHVFHGVLLGLLFGFVVTRPTVRAVVRTDVETDALAETGLALRVVAAGFVFGLALWAILPVIALPVWTGPIGPEAAGEFPAVAVESMVGHALFGLVLGLVFAVTVDPYERPAGESRDGP